MNNKILKKDEVGNIEKELNLNENVHSDYGHHFVGPIKDIIKKRIDVAYLELNKKIFHKLEKYRIGILPVRMITNKQMMVIVYNENGKERAFKLYNIAKRNHGHLNDKTPEEAREIGHLLGYSDNKIEDHINKKYKLQEKISELVKKLDDHNKLKKINKDYKFQKTKNLMSKIKTI